MGLVLILIFAGVLVVIAAPSAALGILAASRSPRQAPFWAALVGTALASAAAQYLFVTGPMLRAGEASWDLFISPVLGYHLAAPVVAAALLWFVPRGPRHPGVGGAAAGLLFSVPLLIVAAIPLGFLVQRVFRLPFVP